MPNTRSGRSTLGLVDPPPAGGSGSTADSISALFDYHPAIAAALRIASYESGGDSSLPPSRKHFTAEQAEAMADNLEHLYGFPSHAARAAWIYAACTGMPVIVLGPTIIGFPSSATHSLFPPPPASAIPPPASAIPPPASAIPPPASAVPPPASSSAPSATRPDGASDSTLAGATISAPLPPKLKLPSHSLDLNSKDVIRKSNLSAFDETFRYTRVVSKKGYEAHARMISDDNKTWTKEMVKQKWIEILGIMIEANQ